MAPLSFAKLFSSRSSSRSNGSDRRSSLDSFQSAESYVISLPSMNAAPVLTRSFEPTATGRLRSSGSIPSPQAGEAEMLDDDNLAWGRPPRKQHSRTKARRARA